MCYIKGCSSLTQISCWHSVRLLHIVLSPLSVQTCHLSVQVSSGQTSGTEVTSLSTCEALANGQQLSAVKCAVTRVASWLIALQLWRQAGGPRHTVPLVSAPSCADRRPASCAGLQFNGFASEDDEGGMDHEPGTATCTRTGWKTCYCQDFTCFHFLKWASSTTPLARSTSLQQLHVMLDPRSSPVSWQCAWS